MCDHTLCVYFTLLWLFSQIYIIIIILHKYIFKEFFRDLLLRYGYTLLPNWNTSHASYAFTLQVKFLLLYHHTSSYICYETTTTTGDNIIGIIIDNSYYISKNINSNKAVQQPRTCAYWTSSFARTDAEQFTLDRTKTQPTSHIRYNLTYPAWSYFERLVYIINCLCLLCCIASMRMQAPLRTGQMLLASQSTRGITPRKVSSKFTFCRNNTKPRPLYLTQFLFFFPFNST